MSTRLPITATAHANKTSAGRTPGLCFRNVLRLANWTQLSPKLLLHASHEPSQLKLITIKPPILQATKLPFQIKQISKKSINHNKQKDQSCTRPPQLTISYSSKMSHPFLSHNGSQIKEISFHSQSLYQISAYLWKR